MAELPSSKSQARLLSLLNLESDGSYGHSARVLEAAGWPSDGIPSGHTWRTAAKLSDAELLATPPSGERQAAARDYPTTTPVESPSVERARRFAERYDAEKRRSRERRALRAAGYEWVVDYDDEDQKSFRLFAPDGRGVSVEQALVEIGA